MKEVLTALFATLAAPAFADGWYFEASLEGGAEFWTFTSATGDASPRRNRGDEIWIIRSDQAGDLGPDGACTFNNCAVKVMLGGQVSAASERVQIAFSNGEALDFEASGGEVLFDNYSTAGMVRRGCSWTTSAPRNGPRSALAGARTGSALRDQPQRWMRSGRICDRRDCTIER